MALIRCFALGCALALVFLIFGEGAALAVTPESPEVKALVEKGLTYLTTATHEQVGGKCLIALAFKKNGRDANHPKVKEAIDACYAAKFASYQEADNYNLGLMIIFLCELENDRHKPYIQRMLTELLKRQKPNGGWGYDTLPQGDTSQTQYACLAMWIADRRGFEVPLQHIGAAMNWLIRTQDRYGGWGYQGNDPGVGQPRLEQTPLTVSLTSAACGSLYILQSLVVVPGEVDPAASKQVVKLPGAVQVVETKRPGQDLPRRPITGVDGALLRKAQVEGSNWLSKNITGPPQQDWEHYAYYAYERFASFKEVAERNEEEEPKWYNDMFKRFSATMRSEGYWDGSDTSAVATAFTVLILSRSTKKAIKRVEEVLGEGIMLGGMGLPPTTADLQERNGKIVESSKGAGNIDQLLSLIEEDNPELIRMAEDPTAAVKLDDDITKRTSQIAKLRSTVTSGTPEARLIAVRSLGRVRSLDNVPILLYALGSEDLRIVYAADRGLRFISRKFDGVLKWEVADEATKQALRKAWREWFLSIKPDAELLD
jgi:hypothetical protein